MDYVCKCSINCEHIRNIEIKPLRISVNILANICVKVDFYGIMTDKKTGRGNSPVYKDN